MRICPTRFRRRRWRSDKKEVVFTREKWVGGSAQQPTQEEVNVALVATIDRRKCRCVKSGEGAESSTRT